MTEDSEMASTRSFSRPLVVLSLIVSAAIIAGAGWAVSNLVTAGGSSNPFGATTPYVSPESSAAKAVAAASASEKPVFQKLAATPSAIWLLPEDHDTASIGDFVASTAAAATTADQTAVFVVYGIPERDCSNQSAGGLSEAEYPGWVAAIAAGLGATWQHGQ